MKKIVIAGAGLVGSMQAVLLAKRGYTVEMYERRPDMRTAQIPAGRSINLACSVRGWKALEMAGVADEVRSTSVEMKGRMMHDTEGNTTFQAYGQEGESIYSVSRGGLNKTLMTAAEATGNVTIHFNERCTDVDLDSPTLSFTNEVTQESTVVSADHVIGADGAFSAVRGAMMKTDRFNYSQSYLSHGYKELCIPAAEEGGFRIPENYLHIWPRGSYMLIALPNIDGSFTCTLFFPFEGEVSFESLQSDDDVVNFFKQQFPDALEHMPTLLEDWHANPTSSLATIRCEPWTKEDKIMLTGDAAHAIVPFYGQGMISGFEDCSVFDRILDDCQDDWSKAVPAFGAERKPCGDGIADLALYNFIEMRDSVANPQFLLRKKIEKKIQRMYPDQFTPLYSLVTFTHTPYNIAWQQKERQDRLFEHLFAQPGFSENWDSPEGEAMIAKAMEQY